MSKFYVWAAIVVIVIVSTTGDLLLSHAMKQIGDLGELRRQRGLLTVVARVLRSPSFLLGIVFMALGFFSLLTALSWGDLSLVAPASASLTFVANAIAAKFLLHEHVDHRRWTAALLVAGGVALLTF
ncbi:MAG TPA: EamA family transporter [Terriglobales bacterium]|nr:EamA family transporter [Terriglobales bacterium]